MRIKDVVKFCKDRIDINNVGLDSYISTENMINDRGGIITATKLPNSKSVLRFKKEQILISNIRPYFKKIWFSEFDGGCSNDILVIDIIDYRVNNKFLYYLLSQDNFFDYMMKTSIGTKMPRGDRNAIMNYELQLPSIEDQKAIANILSTLDKKIEVNNQINKTLENMAQAIFKQWFIDFEFPNEEGQPYKSSGGEMVESELGMIPKEWEISILDEILLISTISVKPNQNLEELFEHYSIPAFDKCKFPNFELGKEIKSNKYKVYKKSILISKLNPTKKRLWNPLNLSDNAICSTEFINYIPKDSQMEEYCYEIINSDNFTEFLINNSTGSTNSRQRVKPKDTLNYQTIKPIDDELIKKFCKIVKNTYSKINNNIIESQKLIELRDTILPRLMSGEIRVPIKR